MKRIWQRAPAPQHDQVESQSLVDTKYDYLRKEQTRSRWWSQDGEPRWLSVPLFVFLVWIMMTGCITLLIWLSTYSLQFTREKTFQITIFEDLHFGENAWEPWGPRQDEKTLEVMNTILDAEDQQLVVLNGDLITGENTFAANNTDYIDMIVKPIVDRGLLFASTYGNHDSSTTLSRERIFEREKRHWSSKTKQAVQNPNAGVTNYYLPVWRRRRDVHSRTSNIPALILWFFDSRGGQYFDQRDKLGKPVGQPNWVDESVVTWFKETHASLVDLYGTVIPSLAFVHIPTNASAALQGEIGIDAHRQPGINDDYILSPQSKGYCPDNTTTTTSSSSSKDKPCTYGGQDIPFMHALTSTPGLLALFSGHNHGDTWCYKWTNKTTVVPDLPTPSNGGVNLCFGQHSGYGGYGNWTRGAREVLVRQEEEGSGKMTIETWIRLETGDVVGKVTLNETYGEDVYPETPNTHSGLRGVNHY